MGVVYHPNIQGCKSLENSVDYIKKGNIFYEEGLLPGKTTKKQQKIDKYL